MTILRPDEKVTFVAELSNNHNGDRGRCGRLIDAAQAAGADWIKLQCYTPDELVQLRDDGPAPEPWGSQGWSMRQLYEKAQTPHDWFPLIAAHCERVGIRWFASVFGTESLALLESLNCPAYKIARLDNGQPDLIDAVRATGKPVIVSAADPFESSWDHSAEEGTWLYCPAGYPQGRFAFDYIEFGNYFDGFSFHGTDPLPCVVAATLGAKIIEAHLQLFSEPSELEANVSLTARQFREMVDQVRRIEGMLA